MTTRYELISLLEELVNEAEYRPESLHKDHPTVVAARKALSDEANSWISNIGRDKCGHPETLSGYSLIEVMYRNGVVDSAQAHAWYESWYETDRQELDIIAYRVLES